ncbi:MAG: hypothetical protein HY558_07475 [Euryarchaeota archaeon]|nr:hypothetical protein [Euryarchaeota archaeon]
MFESTKQTRIELRQKLRQGRFLFPPFPGTYSFTTIRLVLLGSKLGAVAIVAVASELLFSGNPLGLLLVIPGVLVFILPRHVQMVEETPSTGTA